MSRAVPMICLVDGCRYAGRITLATIDQVRKHLVSAHDYFDLQKTAVRLGIISEKEFRGFGWLVRKVSEASIIKELQI